ncbi:TVG1490552 [Thermoplasma volcanium GSS1]|uniref:TVG1490552 protein n=1 Tax=Thermoplasma volcanium (strain ATCC 51530 / DSM 4299 / JCM 9571 / NBRC 15438 / GSS1) TaxID=273116 RepID=Q978H4_THEVO|nr:MvaI/BcnI family restriction endonuclease [Thermoplasma volcanium]BAB60583.1 TVG1490552 [Thermoplasma volcanium GSS1]
MDINQFIEKFKQIETKGFVKSMRRGPTGIGMTLESLLGIKENNISLPDLDGIELKAHRDNSMNLITLFTFNRGAWIMNPLEAVRKYGTLDKNGRLGLYFTMNFTPNSAGLYLFADNEAVSVRHINGDVLVKWNFNDLEDQFKRKVPALIIAYARTEYRGNDEYFQFYKAVLLKGTTKDIIRESIKNNIILIDLRLHDKGTMARNHGTGFRIYEKNLPLVFSNTEVIA